MPDDTPAGSAPPLQRHLHFDTTETRKAVRKYRRDHQVEEEAADDPPLLERTSPKGSLVQTFRLNLPGAAERHRKLCHRLGLDPEANSKADVRHWMRSRPTRRANLRVGLWGFVDRTVWLLAALSAASLFFYYGC